MKDFEPEGFDQALP